VVVPERLNRFLGIVIELVSVVTVDWTPLNTSDPSVGIVALVEVTPALLAVTVEVVSVKFTFPSTSQSPAVRLTLVIFAAVAVVKLTALPVAIRLSISCPTPPDGALSFVVVPRRNWDKKLVPLD